MAIPRIRLGARDDEHRKIERKIRRSTHRHHDQFQEVRDLLEIGDGIYFHLVWQGIDLQQV